MKQTFLAGIMVGALALASTVRASQSGATHYMSGQQADFSTLAPAAPGFYFANYYLNYNDGTFDASKGLPFGRLLAANVTLNTQADVPAMLYAYPLDFLGGTLSSGILVPFIWVDVKASAIFDNNRNPISVGREDKASGLGDIEFIPVMASWTNGDFHFNGMFNFWAPTGDYQTGRMANTGLGYWTFEPMVAVSWISSKIGTEVTFFSALDFNTENNDAN
ncbi:MAG TPA: transporter, partial [Candidatus Acidoferrales bacterium]|nr:transporter [Candidatus Acidoferrales bacterium]